MSVDATGKQARKDAQKESGITPKTESLSGAGDTFLWVRQMGFHLATLRPVHRTTAPKNPVSSLPEDEKKMIRISGGMNA